MVRKLSGILILLFSAANAVQASDPARMPWVDRQDEEVKQFKIQEKKTTKDFDLEQKTVRDWMMDMTEEAKSSGVMEKAEEMRSQNQESMIVFISEGMPEGVLRHLFRQAAAMPKGSVRFVLRGFEPQRLGQLVGRIRKLTDDPMADLISVDVDPPLFRDYDVQAVPVYLVKDGREWFEVQGAISLQGAKEHVAKRGSLVVGELYQIKEPDLLEIIEARARNFDWSSAMERAQARIAQNLSPAFDLPAAVEDETIYHTPIFTVPHDIVAPEYEDNPGGVIARQGDVYNLLDATKLQVPMIVIDSTSQFDEAQLVAWLKVHPNADVFVVGQMASENDKPAQYVLSERYGRPVYPWQGRMTDVFGVRAVPALVTQEGRALRIDYKRARAGGVN